MLVKKYYLPESKKWNNVNSGKYYKGKKRKLEEQIKLNQNKKNKQMVQML